jgi:hypothetical protein
MNNRFSSENACCMHFSLESTGSQPVVQNRRYTQYYLHFIRSSYFTHNTKSNKTQTLCERDRKKNVWNQEGNHVTHSFPLEVPQQKHFIVCYLFQNSFKTSFPFKYLAPPLMSDRPHLARSQFHSIPSLRYTRTCVSQWDQVFYPAHNIFIFILARSSNSTAELHHLARKAVTLFMLSVSVLTS